MPHGSVPVPAVFGTVPHCRTEGFGMGRRLGSSLEMSSACSWLRNQGGNQQRSRCFSLTLFCGLESNLNGK